MAAVGVIHRRNLPRVSRALGRPPAHVGDLIDLGVRFGHAQVWVHPDVHDELGLPAALDVVAPAGDLARAGVAHPFVAAAAPTHHVAPAGLAPWIVGRPLGARRERVDVALPAYDDATPLRTAADARELVDALTLYRELVGIPYRRSPGASSGDLIRATHAGSRAIALDASGEPPEPACDGATEADFFWCRELLVDELAARYVYAFDANGRYLASCSSVELGLGEPEHVLPNRQVGLAFDPRRAGYWHVPLRAALAPGLPDPFDPRGRGDHGPRWWATPTVELAAELGAIAGPITAAYLYPRRSRFLEPYYTRLRDARRALLELDTPAAAIALALVKRTYQHGIGALAGGWLHAGDELYRPDWRHAIVARARTALWRRLARPGEGRAPIRPIALDVDALYVCSDSDTPGAAAERLGLPLGSELGRFKCTGRTTPALAAEAIAGARSPALAIAALRELTDDLDGPTPDAAEAGPVPGERGEPISLGASSVAPPNGGRNPAKRPISPVSRRG